MNLQDLQTMIDYHYWARDRLLDALESLTPEQYNRALGSSFKAIRETVTHIDAAEWAWYMRWRGQSPPALLPSERFSDPGAVRTAWSEQQADMLAFVNGLDYAGVACVI